MPYCPSLRLEFDSHPFPSLWQVPDPPSHLFVQGSDRALALLERIPEDGLAVVGTRHPQARSRALVQDWLRVLRSARLIIISGLARGIDAEAHEAALDSGLPTIAILGTPLASEYPRENARLRERILAQDGLVVSEFMNEEATFPSHFIRRNRLIAGWSKATWVVEAGSRSGALNTARWAREQNRLCFATPGFPGDPALGGNLQLLDREDALPLWSPPTLGHAWPELPSRLASSSRRGSCRENAGLDELPGGGDAGSLTTWVRERAAAAGGASVQELLDRAMAADWTPQRFFSALRDALQTGRLADEQGVLVPKNFRIPEL
ncbi:MAG: DNA-protecting protein DprA [Oligoflexia bacterium]|nr:DNA-protecting protein DprA [Oligoflexia bacterium]